MRTEHQMGAADVDEDRRRRQLLWVPVLVNLLLGVPALVPLYCVQWLLTEYLPMDCRSIDPLDPAVGSTNCNYSTLDDGPTVTLLLAVTGIFVLALVVLVDVVLPRARGRRVLPWLGSAVLLFGPYVAIWATR